MDPPPMVSRHPLTDDSDRGHGVLDEYHVPINYTGKLAARPGRTERARGHFCWTNDARFSVLRRADLGFHRLLFAIRGNRADDYSADSAKMAK